jgi:hypothetical protein
MAAASYTTDLAVLSLADATTGFDEPTGSTAGGNAASETDFFIQGASCVSKTFNATGVGGLAYTAGAAVTIPTDGAAYVWTYYSCPNALATKVNGGVQILIGNSATAYKRFYVAGSDTYTYGGWVNYPVNPTVTSSLNEGSPTAVTQVFGMAVNSVNSVTKGNPFGIDAIRYGRGTLQVTGGDLANGYGTFTGASTQNDLVANRWGILSFVDGTYKYQGHLLLGTATTAVDFRDSNKAVVIQNTQFVTSNFNLIEVRNAASNVSLTSMSISALGTVSRGNFLVTNNATVLLDSCTFTDMGTFVFLSNTTVDSVVFRRCGAITHGNASMWNCLVTGSYATSAITTTNPANIQDCQFVSAGTGHAITITTPGTYTFSGNLFSGYGATGTTNAAVYNNSGGLVTLNVSGGGDVPTYRNGTSATTTIVAAANVTLTGLIADTEIRAFVGTDPATSTEIGGVESSGTSFTFSQSVAGSAGYIQIFHVDYQPITLSVTYSGSDTSIPVQQIGDRQYNRGSIYTPG